MSALWGEVSEMIEVGELFPGVISRPFGIAMPETRTKENKATPRQMITAKRHLARHKEKGNGFGYQVLSSLKPAPTLSKMPMLSTSSPRYIENNQHWFPSTQELKAIGGWPLDTKFHCKWLDQWHIIGNSVPPLLMKAIATQIRHKLWGGDPLTRYPKTMTYPEILEAAWQDHLKPRDPDAPTVISTFAGGGGSSLGYSMAGYRELLAVEWDDNAVATFKLNFPDVPVYHGDIAKLSVEECMRLAGVKEGELDLLDGSPPCQGVSTAGKRILNDPRNQLFREFVRLLRGLKPKVFVMENVPGLVKGKMKLIFAEIMRELKASGYQVRCKKLNAMYFYVPQSRERLIFIGVRNDLEVNASYPSVESRPVTLKNSTDCKVYDFGQKPPKASELKKKRWQNTPRGNNHYKRFSLSRLSWNSPSVTLQKTATGSTGVMHPDQPRELYEWELKRIGSYPDDFKFSGRWVNTLACIGNSVPPLFMRSIAEHIRNTILQPELIK
jgi:DNA (cytosine-5)-methyltransferase 1